MEEKNSVPYVPPVEIPENNITPVLPCINFLYLFGTVVTASAFIFFLLGVSADWLATRLSAEREIEFGQWFMQALEEPIIEQDKRIAYLQRLVDALPASGETIRLPLEVHLLNDEAINAAAFLGGHVLINTGLLKAVESENELAFVLAHEIGHFKARDPLKTLGRSLVYLLASQMIGLVYQPSGINLVSLTREFTALSYSRQQETQADKYALSCIYRRYGHVEHALDLFTRLEQLESERGEYLLSQYFSTHPTSASRREDLMKIAEKNGWATTGIAIPLPEGIKCPDMDCPG